MEREVTGPFRGVANNSAFIRTPQDLVPFAGMRNVLLHAPQSDRPRFGQRPGLSLRFPQQLAGGASVQAFGVIQRSSGDSSYERVDTPSQVMAWTDADDVYRYSHRATRYERSGTTTATGDPHVGWVLASNLSVSRAIGRVLDTATAADLSQAIVDNNRPSTTKSDILRVKGKFSAGYEERTADDHQVTMGMQAAWHPQAGVADDANEHTIVFTSLIAPGTNISGPTNGSLYTSVTCMNVDTGEILWRNVCKDMDAIPSGYTSTQFNTAVLASTATFIDNPGGGNIMASAAPINVISRHVLVQDDYTYVSAAHYVYVFNTETGAYLMRFNCDGWSQNVVRVIPRNGIARDMTNQAYDDRFMPRSILVVFSGTNANNGSFSDNCTGVGPMPGASDDTYVQGLAHWRSGVCECFIQGKLNGDPYTQPGNYTQQDAPAPAFGDAGYDFYGFPIVRMRMPAAIDTQPGANETVTESVGGVAHQTLRFSFMLARKPRGGIPYAACGGTDPIPVPTTVVVPAPATENPLPNQSANIVVGDYRTFYASRPFFVGITNRGYGLTSATPDALVDANLGTGAGWLWPNSAASPTTIAKFDGDGALLWEIDTQSLLREYLTSTAWYNDIPIANGPSGPEASIMAMACDSSGNLYAAGKRNNVESQGGSGVNVFKIDGSTGRIVWSRSLAGTIGQNCLCINPIDGSVYLSGKRNNDWVEGAITNTYAMLWKLSPVDGRVLSYFDFGMDNSLWGNGVPGASSDSEANSNSWLSLCSSYGIDVDQSGRIAFCTTPGV